MGRLQRLFRWLNVILIFLTLLVYLSPYIHPASLWLFAVLGLLYPVLLALHLLFALIWLTQRKVYALFSLGCILLGWGHFTAFIGLNLGGGLPGSDERHLRVMTYNVYGFTNKNQVEAASGRRWSEAHVLDFYSRYQPEVWCIQEFPTVPKYTEQFSRLITTRTPLKYVYFEPGKALAIFSRYPLRGVKQHYFNNYTNGYAVADLEKEGHKIRIFNIHLQSNAVSQLADEVAQNGQIQEKKTWLKIKGIIGRYRRTASLRADQARDIRDQLQESPYPIILCGDFNDVPLSYAYGTLSRGLTDGFRKKGRGLGTTFLGSLPALRIDYVLSSPALRPQSYHVLPVDRSDHYPVLSVLKLPQGDGPGNNLK